MYTIRSIIYVLALAACGGPEVAPEPEPEPPPPEPLPTEPEEARPIIEELNRFCSMHDDCGISEAPEQFPNREQTTETANAIASRRDRLRALGVEIVWDGARFATQATADVRMITGGNFSPDHVGPERFESARERALARPDLYLGIFVEDIVGPDPDAGHLSQLHPGTLIELVRERSPEMSARAVSRLLPLYQSARAASNPPPAEDEYREVRLRDRIATLEQLEN